MLSSGVRVHVLASTAARPPGTCFAKHHCAAHGSNTKEATESIGHLLAGLSRFEMPQFPKFVSFLKCNLQAARQSCRNARRIRSHSMPKLAFVQATIPQRAGECVQIIL